MLNSSKFPEDSCMFTIKIVHVLFRLQPSHLHKCHLSHLNWLHIPQVTYLVEHWKIGQKSTNSGKSLEPVTHCHKPLHHHVEIPLPTGICSELIRHSIRKISSRSDVNSQSPYSIKSNGQGPTLGTNCHTGVVYDNLSVMFMHTTFSINNKVG